MGGGEGAGSCAKERTRPPQAKAEAGVLRRAGRPAGAARGGRKGLHGAGRRVAVTQGGRFKPKEGSAAAPREAGVGVAIAGPPLGRGRGFSSARPAVRRPLGLLVGGSGGPQVCASEWASGRPQPRAPPCFPGAGTREAPRNRSLFSLRSR